MRKNINQFTHNILITVLSLLARKTPEKELNKTEVSVSNKILFSFFIERLVYAIFCRPS